MKGTFTWKWAVLALSVAALVAVGCAKKQTVKSEGAPGAAAPGAPAPSDFTVCFLAHPTATRAATDITNTAHFQENVPFMLFPSL